MTTSGACNRECVHLDLMGARRILSGRRFGNVFFLRGSNIELQIVIIFGILLEVYRAVVRYTDTGENAAQII